MNQIKSILENLAKPEDLVAQFQSSSYFKQNHQFRYRGHCTEVANAFKVWATEQGVDTSTFKITEGMFKADNIVSAKRDLTDMMRYEMKKLNLNPGSREDRYKFISEHPTRKHEWKYIPHAWVKDNKGNIYDPSGKYQFINTGLAADLNRSRYREESQWAKHPEDYEEGI